MFVVYGFLFHWLLVCLRVDVFVRWLVCLFVVRWFLFVACVLLRVGSCLLFLVCCFLFVVDGVLYVVACLFDCGGSLLVACCVWFVECCFISGVLVLSC